MGTRTREYETVDYKQLKGAKSVANFAKEYDNGRGCNRVYIYKLEKDRKIRIVDFEGVNFVLPIK